MPPAPLDSSINPTSANPGDVVDFWHPAMQQLATALLAEQVHPADAVVLLPYAQLMTPARHAWARLALPADAAWLGSFVPRFETTHNWATGGALGFFMPSGDDLRMDVAFDMLTAASLLQRAGLASQQDLLARRVVDAAWSLARVAAAQPPALRAEWGTQLALSLAQASDSALLAYEAVVGRLALAWVAHSAYATDRLFSARPALLAVMTGFQAEPLSQALQALHALQLHGARAELTIALVNDKPPPVRTVPRLFAAQDAEDEAEQAAACVLQHLAAGRQPVALVAQDRLLTRRVGAMLAQRGVRMRDETGWKLSTTRAAASVMSLLRASAWDASTDAVLDWLKHTPTWPEAVVTAAETELRKLGLRNWRDLPAPLLEPLPEPEPLAESPSPYAADGANPLHFSAHTSPRKPPRDPLHHTRALAASVNPLRESLSRARPLSAWLRDLRAALHTSGQWDALADDDAGNTVLSALHLHDGAEAAFDFAPSMALAAFTAWADQALEGSTYNPTPATGELAVQVLVLPLPQLLGRNVAAVVFAGCDEVNLPVSPEPAGPWLPEQRVLLGLPSRQEVADANRRAWQYALAQPHLDVLWRISASGERLAPSGFVQTLLLDHGLNPETCLSPDARACRTVLLAPTLQPQPVGQALPVTRLSASAYDDLRRCPYRFFALRQLRLNPADELESELDKRDFGNWLHSTLSLFHESLKKEPNQPHALGNSARVAMINIAADEATKALGLSHAEFLPFAAAWPRVRDGYLAWLADHEATGAQFETSETEHKLPLGTDGLSLIGKIDRIDTVHPPDGAPPYTLVIDYKTEPRAVTLDRIKFGGEDTQLAFYAALMADDTLGAAYVNLGEKEPTKTYDQPDINAMRVVLIESVLSDMTRIAGGAVLPALGEGKACEYCNARGLCRRDYWSK